jgi:hypothetical protein
MQELAVAPQDKVYYTMKDVVLYALQSGDPKAIDAFPLSRLINIFMRICDPMAFSFSCL